jgi:phosphoribosylformylglycinamidine cyclo-ligase
VSQEALRYGSAGVDLESAGEAKQRLKRLVESTFTAGSVGGFGGFGGMFRVPSGMKNPILVSSADGVGTKVKVAIEANKHDTVGRDLVNHCVNDILVQGAIPLFFLDYVAFGKLDPAIVEQIVAGIARGCIENGCALAGGETAEMPGVYTPPDYDLAGFIVGAVEEENILGPHRAKAGDALVALPSAGLHTNGYSLARKIVSERMGLGPEDSFPGSGKTVAEMLLAEHRSYLGALRPVLKRIHAMAHITVGGLPGNLDRALPDSLDAVVDSSSWQIPALYGELQRAGNVERDEMYRTFNMGVGMVVAVTDANVRPVLESAASAGITGWVIGSLKPGTGKVIL